MAIEDRTREQITLISPDTDGNQEYSAKWIGDPISKEKKLGLFDSPKIKGTKVQDLEIKGAIHQLTVYFDGEDHDEDSAAFWASLDAKGAWSVIHPQLGPIENLYLSRVTWQMEPVRSVGFTTFDTSWIEGLPEATQVSIAEQTATLNADIFDAIDSAIDQFLDNISLDNFEEYNALVSATNKAVNSIKKNLRKFENLQIINPQLEALFNGIATTLESFPPDTTALATQFVGLYNAIGNAQNSTNGAIENMIGIIAGQDDVATDDPGTNGRNAAAVAELNASLANTQIAKAVLLPGTETRDQAIGTATTINAYFESMMASLEATQENFDNTPIEDQYVAQSGSFADQLTANRRAVQFLISSALSLKIEKVFTTKVPRSPIEIAWDELGGPGEIIEEDFINIDQNFADFCRWNDLHNLDLIWLPADTVVRVFV